MLCYVIMKEVYEIEKHYFQVFMKSRIFSVCHYNVHFNSEMTRIGFHIVYTSLANCL